MARIALRVYNNEINDLIDHGQTEEAVAHCRHILQTYSKHVNTYRLLGKAYLEDQRYGEAADILQRVLSSIPEDFISQVGMSIIREDEGNLDTAIFHMERAFEVQPSNHAIQDELRRLYGRRDGLEPQRIRLTRGALARMYAHGHLYDQAIAELLAALSEDSQRYDLMVLLANMYFQADKKVDSAETCTKIIEKLPYCLDANRLLVTILESSNRENNARTYRDRWEQLDPYAAALDTDHSSVEFVSDQSITVEGLEWEPGDYDYKPDSGRAAWASSLGSDFGESSLEEPTSDWMSRRGDDQSDLSESLLSETPSEEEEKSSLDWLPTLDKEPGDFDLGTTSGPSDPEVTPPIPFNEEETVKPEWIATPTNAEEKPEESPLKESLFPSEDEPETTPDWMTPSDEDVSEPIGETSDSTEAIPDFMKEVGWETSTDDVEEPPPAFSESIPSEKEDDVMPGEVPEWMQDIAPSEEDIVEPTPSSLIEDSIEGGIEAEAVPDWQQSIKSGDVEPQVDAAGINEADTLTSPLEPLGGESFEEVSSTDDDDGMAWLESLAAKQGIAEEELVTSPEEREGALPAWFKPGVEAAQSDVEEEPSMEWLDQLSQEAAHEAAPSLDEEETPDWLQTEEPWEPQPQPEIPIPTGPKPTETPPSSDDEEEMAWLKNLAAKQDIVGEELVTSQEEKDDTSLEWLKTNKDISQADIEEEPSLDWLDNLSQETQIETKAAPSTEKINTAERESDEWLASLGLSETDADAPIVAPTEDEKTDWLDRLAPFKDTVEEEAIPDLGDHSEDSLDWLTQAKKDLPPDFQLDISQERLSIEDEPSDEWLEQLSQETDLESDTGEQVESTEEWLAELDELEEEIVAEEEMGATPEAIEKMDEWIQSLGKPEEEGEELLEIDSEEPLFPSDILEEEEPVISFLEEEQPKIELDADTFPSTVLEKQIDIIPESPTTASTTPEDQFDTTSESETTPSIIPEDQLDAMLESETTPSIVPEWLQDVAEQRPEPDAIDEPPEWLPSIDEPPEEDVGGITPTLPGEWQPESKMEAPQPATKSEQAPKPMPKQKPKPSVDISEELENARLAISDADIEEATNIYAKLIKKGKGVEEIIEDIEEALHKHPIDVSLWQTLGDALMRADRLQEALDAYSKAEDLLR